MEIYACSTDDIRNADEEIIADMLKDVGAIDEDDDTFYNSIGDTEDVYEEDTDEGND